MSAASGVPARNRIAYLKARAKARKDPLARAVRAPAKKPTPNLCPLGQCEHAGLLHVQRHRGGEPSQTICSVCECKEKL